MTLNMGHRNDCVVKVAHSDEDCTPHHWEVVGATFSQPSDSNPNSYYTITVRPDTNYGGTYLHCTCPAWARSIAKGGCKHVIRVRGGRAPLAARVRARHARAPHIERKHTAAASDEDIMAAAKLLAWGN